MMSDHPSRPPSRVALVVVEGPRAGARTVLAPGRPMTIGRDGRCELPIDDRLLSRRHCTVALQDSGEVLVTDLMSANGTYINDARVTNPVPAREGDLIRIGENVLELRAHRAGAISGRGSGDGDASRRNARPGSGSRRRRPSSGPDLGVGGAGGAGPPISDSQNEETWKVVDPDLFAAMVEDHTGAREAVPADAGEGTAHGLAFGDRRRAAPRAVRHALDSGTDVAEVVESIRLLAAAGGFADAEAAGIADAAREAIDNVRQHAPDASAGVSARIAASGIRIEVWDQGPGIPADVQRTLQSARTGGLVRARSLVSELEVISLPGHTQVFLRHWHRDKST